MASKISLAGCLFLACVFSFANAQPPNERMFKQLSAAELRELDISQNPGLLDLAARIGERVVIDITGPEQGGVVQDGVNVVLNCSSWLSNFPGGTIVWYRYLYFDLDHTLLGPRDEQTKSELNVPNSLRRIEGEFDEIFNITRVRIQMGAEDPHRGIYECEVCTARGNISEQCHSANVTLPIVGRPPILDFVTGSTTDPGSDGINHIYRIGSTICVRIDDDDHLNNVPLSRVELKCPNVEALPFYNIPPDIPTPTRTWTHTSLDGTTAVMASDEVRSEPRLTDEFIAAFPLLLPWNAMNIFVVISSGHQDTLFFETFNVTRNLSERYKVLQQAFGFWTCKLNNSLGSVEATTYISNNCTVEVKCSTTSFTCDGTVSNPPTAYDCCVGGGMSYIADCGCQICYVVGFTNDPESLRINEGDEKTLTVGLLKPPAGVGALAFVSFIINNSLNTADVRVGGSALSSGTLLSTFRQSLRFTLRAQADRIGQECIESFDIPITITAVIPSGLTAFTSGPAVVKVTDTTDRISVGYNMSNITVEESVGSVELCAVITSGGGLRPFNLTVNTIKMTADSDDYDDVVDDVLSFNISDIAQCHNISVRDDRSCEYETEHFISHLTTDDCNIAISIAVVNVYIDDQSEVECSNISVGYNMSNITVEESVGSVELCAVITSGRGLRPFNLTVQTMHMTADSEVYDEVVDDVLSFHISDIEQCYNISVGDDRSCEYETEHFISHLTTDDYNIAISISKVNLYIEDQREMECSNISVGYNMSNITVEESSGSVELCAVITSGEGLRPFNLTVNTIKMTADENDFDEIVNHIMSFNISHSEQCHYINILNDDNCECQIENLVSNLTTEDNVNIDVFMMNVYIDDQNEPECQNNGNGCEMEGPTEESVNLLLAVLLPGILFLLLGSAILIMLIVIYRWRTHRLKSVDIDSVEIESDVPEDDTDTDFKPPEQLSLMQQLQEQVPKNKVFPKSSIQLGITVGQGEFGLVYRGYLSTSVGKELVAVKTLKALYSETDVNKMVKEIIRMVSFIHPNVMPLTGVCTEGQSPLLIMPFMSNGNVLEYVRHHKEELMLTSEATDSKITEARKLMLGMCHQISQGMQYLTKEKFVHRDLAARNCMIDMNGVIKVADFGLTEDMYGANYFRRRKSDVGAEDKVPIRWMAPESLENDIYNQSTDVWAFGVTCWEVFTCGQVPYRGINAMSLMRTLRNGERLDKPNNSACSQEIYNLMFNCWYEDPHQRPRFSSLVQGLSNMLEEEAGYLNLSLTLSWKKEPEQRSVAFPAGPALLTIEEGGEEGRVGNNGVDVELENLSSGVERKDTHTPPENISSF